MVTEDKIKLYLFQFSDLYGDEIYLPYSVGMIWSYARTLPEVANAYSDPGFVFRREEPSTIVSQLDNPGVAAFSTYVWNWEMSVAVARLIKERFPDCLIVFGGPQVPNADRLGSIFETYPFIDVLTHGEGEITFAEILKEHACGGNLKEIKGITYDGVSTESRPRTPDLSFFPSPYLTGVFDELFELPYKFHTVWESNRGCPYGCSFCDWGSSTMQKLHKFVEERLFKEIDYFGEKKISHVYMADANFGIIPRDVDVANYLADTKRKTGGFPAKLRVNYAKNNPDRVHQIAKILNAEQLDKGITLSVQTMNEDTLKINKRKNLKYDTLSSFIKEYQREGINTYTEIIMGLPGETYETFREGIDQLLGASAHNSLYMYRCSVLPNAPMNDVDFREEHGIRTARSPISLFHTRPGSDPVTEYEEMIVETAALSKEEYRRTLTLAWAVQTFHALNLTQIFAIYANSVDGLRFTDFYQHLLQFAARRPDSILGQEFLITGEKFDEVLLHNGHWDSTVPEFSDLTWPLEEASYLRLMLRHEQFYEEFKQFLDELQEEGLLTMAPELRRDLLTYQKAVVVKWDEDGSTTLDLDHSVHSFHRGILTGEPKPLRKGRFRLHIRDPYGFSGDKKRYSTEIVFWGRRRGATIYHTVEEEDLHAPTGHTIPGSLPRRDAAVSLKISDA
jgi:radical SAM superfamily enzyme YgiQ (UPF0313 family)